MNIVDTLKKVLANNFAFYLKAQYFHWNVEGSDFYQLHNFFGDLYEEVYGSIDHLAEEIRALKAYAPGSFERYIQLSDVKGDDRILTSQQMLQQLLSDNEIVINSYMEALQLADESKAVGLSDFIQGRVDQHQKHAWMLRSFLKE